jgi:hypothetical protein
VDVIEAPGCPEGSVAVVTWIKEKKPVEFVVKTHDEDCIKVLKIILPLFNYVVVDLWKEGDFNFLKSRRVG